MLAGGGGNKTGTSVLAGGGGRIFHQQTEQHLRERVPLLLGWEHNVCIHVCKNTPESFDWLIKSSNQ